jgi:hypothetical protein
LGSTKHTQFFRKHVYSLVTLIAILIFLIYPNIGMYDWNKEIQYSDFIKQSILNEKEYPMFMWNSGILSKYPAVKQSALFAGNPETMLFSPFLPLLLILPPVVFSKLLVLIHFLIGWAGICVLSKTCRWTVRQTRIFSALFMLSPIIIQHLAIGYLPWFNLFFFPWLLNYFLQENSFKKWMGTSIVLALILLQGGLHIFVWLVFFIAFFSILETIFQKKIKCLLLAIASGLTASILALPRLATSFQAFGGFEQNFFSGYSLGAFLKWGLVPPFFTPASMDDIEFFIEEYIKGVPYWDGSQFWGFLLVCVLALPFAIGSSHKKETSIKTRYREASVLALAVSSEMILILSFDGLYASGISFLSNLIQFPALKGMEKYPFRFSILAYYGFAFVCVWYWDHIQTISTIVINFIWSWMIIFWKAFMRFASYLQKRKKIVAWIASFFLFISIAFIALKSIFINWLNSQIALAYAGGGADLLSDLMSGSATIPLIQYINKASTLIGYIQKILFWTTGIVLCVGLIAIIKPIPTRENTKTSLRKIIFPFWVMETLVVVPLMLSFGMWWRVSLATPMKTVPAFEMGAPISSFTNVETGMAVPEMQFSPNTLQLVVTQDMIGETLVFENIPQNDLRFLRIEKGSAKLNEKMGKTAITFESDGKVLLKVNSDSIVFSMLIGMIGWILSIFQIVKFRRKKRINN